MSKFFMATILRIDYNITLSQLSYRCIENNIIDVHENGQKATTKPFSKANIKDSFLS